MSIGYRFFRFWYISEANKKETPRALRVPGRPRAHAEDPLGGARLFRHDGRVLPGGPLVGQVPGPEAVAEETLPRPHHRQPEQLRRRPAEDPHHLRALA